MKIITLRFIYFFVLLTQFSAIDLHLNSEHCSVSSIESCFTQSSFSETEDKTATNSQKDHHCCLNCHLHHIAVSNTENSSLLIFHHSQSPTQFYRFLLDSNFLSSVFRPPIA